MSFKHHANIALLKHTLSASARGMDYAPDTINPSNPGPHTVVIGRMLARQAQAWADDMVEAHADGARVDGKARFLEAMALVDERIRAYCISNGITKGRDAA